MKTLKDLVNEELHLNEAVIDSRETFKGVKYHIMYQAPKGYYIKGGDAEAREEVFNTKQQYFDKSSQAQEHAELEITGYLG